MEIMFNYVMEVTDRQKCDKEIGRYSSAKAQLVHHMEMVASTKYSQACTALDV